MADNTFSIDLTALYNHIGNGETQYGYHIEYDKYGYRDLYEKDYRIISCDGETCEIVNSDNDYVVIRNSENDTGYFKLSKSEFYIASNNIVGVCNRCGNNLYPSESEGYKYQCFGCDEDFYGFEQD